MQAFRKVGIDALLTAGVLAPSAASVARFAVSTKPYVSHETVGVVPKGLTAFSFCVIELADKPIEDNLPEDEVSHK